MRMAGKEEVFVIARVFRIRAYYKPCLRSGNARLTRWAWVPQDNGNERHPFRNARRGGPYHPEPTAGAQRAHPCHGRGDEGAARRLGGQFRDRVRRHSRGGRARLLRRRRYSRHRRIRTGGNALRARFLARRIYPERRDQALSKALYGADARHRDGRRAGRVGARKFSRRRRHGAGRHAGNRHRIFPRRRRQLFPVAQPRRDRHVSRVDRRAAEDGGCALCRHCHASRSRRNTGRS